MDLDIATHNFLIWRFGGRAMPACLEYKLHIIQLVMSIFQSEMIRPVGLAPGHWMRHLIVRRTLDMR
jgi:hypothetical protein